jgi:hypothetical protein
MEVQLANDPDGAFHRVWQADSLHKQPVIAVRWDPQPVWGVRVIIHREMDIMGETNVAGIEEITFPGYYVISPQPRRNLPTLRLKSLKITGAGLLTDSENATDATWLVLGSTSISLRPDISSGRLLAKPPQAQLENRMRVEAYLTDGIRRSNSVSVSLAPAVIIDVQPRATPVGIPFVPQPDGTSALSITCDGGGPGDVVLFDDKPLPTIFGNEHWLTAKVRPELLARPGHHTIGLRNMVGVSNRIDFEVSP